MAMMASLLRPTPLLLIAALLRAALLVYGTYQDAHSAIKYTDIDYLVFTDASRYVWHAQSPYARDTYRYTPLLAWLLLPTVSFFSFGKVVFALADLLAGWLILRILRRRGIPPEQAGAFAALWLWNPMVATISTRGSAEGLLGVLATALVWAAEGHRVNLAAALLGLGVHFKIYPCIWAPAIAWWMDDDRPRRKPARRRARFLSRDRIQLAAVSLATFTGLNVLMYAVYVSPPFSSPRRAAVTQTDFRSYGRPFLVHTFFHHLTRIDHRHNFSPYNVLLYLASSRPGIPLHAESLAFLPQLSLSCVLIPLVLAKKDLATTMMAQTFAFVTFNKVCTSQYFLWYMIFLPLYLPTSTFLRKPRLGMTALVLWLVSQGAWLHQGYELEFLGRSTFFPGLWASSVAFFLVNCWILGVIISDGGAHTAPKARTE
ncbi:GPI mannosyltransferase 1 [Metarhizium brunneum]|uniref:GPI mannosyltransferase 1 n=1 Tax=Metarhizium brunneum TaxID=500148 RepID=A0A7D5YYQ7_9HYPO|nr:GPI mannosyltransferase 1 [Metarhizium brunneum]